MALSATIEVAIHLGQFLGVSLKEGIGSSREGGFDGVGQTRRVKDVFSNRDRVNEEPLSKITPVIQRYEMPPFIRGSVIPIVYPRHKR